MREKGKGGGERGDKERERERERGGGREGRENEREGERGRERLREGRERGERERQHDDIRITYTYNPTSALQFWNLIKLCVKLKLPVYVICWQVCHCCSCL